MKKWVTALCTICILLSLGGCGKSESVQSVEQKISNIGVDISTASQEAIEEAEAAYASLTPEEQAEVHNYPVLVSARALYEHSVMMEDYNGAVKLYNDSVASYNKVVDDYNAAVENAAEKTDSFHEFLESLRTSGLLTEKAYDESTVETLNTMYDNAVGQLAQVPEPMEYMEELSYNGLDDETPQQVRQSANEVLGDAARVAEDSVALSLKVSEIPKPDYTDLRNAIQEQWNLTRASVNIQQQITRPDADYLLTRLEWLGEDLSGMAAATADTDPQGYLGQSGWYTDAVYFAVPDGEGDSYSEEEVLASGVEAGGAIEVYASEEEAVSRAESLQEQESTTVLGTMVIRTASWLPGSQENRLVSEIVYVMTYLLEE